MSSPLFRELDYVSRLCLTMFRSCFWLSFKIVFDRNGCFWPRILGQRTFLFFEHGRKISRTLHFDKRKATRVSVKLTFHPWTLKINGYFIYDADQIHVYFLNAHLKYTCAAYMAYWSCACLSRCKNLRSGPDMCRHETFPARRDSEMDQKCSDMSSNIYVNAWPGMPKHFFSHAKIAKQREIRKITLKSGRQKVKIVSKHSELQMKNK